MILDAVTLAAILLPSAYFVAIRVYLIEHACPADEDRPELGSDPWSSECR